MSFARQRILITGATEGIGRALCLELAPDHPRLVLAARNAARLDSIVAECRALGAQAIGVVTEVANRADCEALVARTVQEYEGLDILVNNAGSTMWTRFEDIQDLGIFEQLMRVNYLSAVWLTSAALPHLRASRGLLVAVASMAGLTGVPERTAYAASKHAMVGFFDSLRIELAGSGVDVTVIAPDFVLSEIHKRAIGADGQPLGESPLVTSRIMTAQERAKLMRRAMARRQRLLVTSLRGRFGRLLKFVAPGVVDRIAARAIRRRS